MAYFSKKPRVTVGKIAMRRVTDDSLTHFLGDAISLSMLSQLKTTEHLAVKIHLNPNKIASTCNAYTATLSTELKRTNKIDLDNKIILIYNKLLYF